ncbi:MAG: Macrolide export ATP-binding/permease protein MacB [Verrucomicrobiales bacterium]|nr:Macrolide export ATP-binding/permease protein MacB [Verrucomicrobiales bacterium]
MALGALAAHKLRSALTLLGVVVGVFSIIVVMTAMRVMQSNIERELGQLGAQTFSVQKHPAIFVNGREGWEKVMRRKNIVWQQVQSLKEKATLAQNVAVEAGLARDQMSSRYAQFDADVAMSGVTPETFAARNWVVEQGRAIISSDVDSARSVCVLGATVAKQLFPHSSAVGEKVKFRGIQYQVAGVLESRGRTLGGDQDSFMVIPITTGFNRFGVQGRSLTILVQASTAELLEDTMEQVRGVLRAIRKVPPQEPDDFELFTNDTLIAQFRTITFATRAGAAVISSIALLAAGIGIMNIMLVSVTERTREIGIRRAIGARKRNILVQFISEAIVICQIGGLIGAFLGILGGNITAFAFKVPPVFPLDWTILSVVICTLVGLIFGTYPAVKAANMDPVEALRYE